MVDVHGKLELDVSLPSKFNDDTLAMLDVNYRLHPDLIVSYKVIATDSKGNEIELDCHSGKVTLDEVTD
ncbi:hypothetical protein [Bacillus sp. UMB0728]|uniref:hypothetical protein n=1 Tax=Bacillus sp. UMB0728 TaxID=2066052 RepID=UPI000C768A21|nr:hypothetical protein [Bacillus sp. UMB0728]PLR72322.1 hypothetical protein CYJ37_12260 [Bacillus sp. UMB0728]